MPRPGIKLKESTQKLHSIYRKRSVAGTDQRQARTCSLCSRPYLTQTTGKGEVGDGERLKWRLQAGFLAEADGTRYVPRTGANAHGLSCCH